MGDLDPIARRPAQAPPAICRYCKRDAPLINIGPHHVCFEHYAEHCAAKDARDWRDVMCDERMQPWMVREADEASLDYVQRTSSARHALAANIAQRMGAPDVPF